MTPLKGADGQIYAMAQGNVLVSGAGAAVGGAKAQVNHLDVGLVPNGATVERAVLNSLGQDNVISLELKQADFATASMLVNTINQRFGTDTAAALDSRVIQVRTPLGSNQRVAFIGALEALSVNPPVGAAKVVMNARTGSVVMSQAVMLDPCAVSHGNLSVVIKSNPEVSQPAPFSKGKTVVTQSPDIEIKSEPGQVMMLKGGAQLADVVKALNAMGTTPQDLLAILQAMKSAGALHADLEII
jgi:flagellar P-ring protein precursor FlgI